LARSSFPADLGTSGKCVRSSVSAVAYNLAVNVTRRTGVNPSVEADRVSQICIKYLSLNYWQLSIAVFSSLLLPLRGSDKPSANSKLRELYIQRCVQHYCVERPFRPPPKSFKPLFDNLYLCGPADDTTTYKGHFQPPRQVPSLLFSFNT